MSVDTRTTRPIYVVRILGRDTVPDSYDDGETRFTRRRFSRFLRFDSTQVRRVVRSIRLYTEMVVAAASTRTNSGLRLWTNGKWYGLFVNRNGGFFGWASRRTCGSYRHKGKPRLWKRRVSRVNYRSSYRGIKIPRKNEISRTDIA